MSTRLNKTIRSAIRKAMVAKAMEADNKAVVTAMHAAADAAYHSLFDKTAIDKMNALPAGWLPTDNGLQVRFDGGWLYPSFKDGSRRFTHSKHNVWVVELSPDAQDKMREYSRLRDVAGDKERQLHTEVSAILSSVTTTKALAQKWPESKPFIESVVGEKQTMLPAFNVDELNKKLGLV